MIVLSHADWSLTLRPELGASVTRLTWRGRDILRPAPDGATHPLETAGFPLVPYANRIAHGAFVFEDRGIAVRPTPGFEPHALHGVGWFRDWTVFQSSPDVVDLTVAVEAGADWPWTWTASHRLQLDADGLELTLSVTNDDRTSMPAGLGFHPYFATDPGTVLTLEAKSVWITEGDIPRSLKPVAAVADWSPGLRTADAPFVDNAYVGWSREARLDHLAHTVGVAAASNARWVQVYAPGEGGFVCIEPVTHRPDAHNAPPDEEAGLFVLAPGRTLSTSMRITAAETGDPR